jgi:hypothetical protein
MLYAMRHFFGRRSVKAASLLLGLMAFLAGRVVWRTREVPELRMLGLVQMALLLTIVGWFHFKAMPFLRRKAFPVGWLKPWVITVGFCMIYSAVSVGFSRTLEDYVYQRFPWPGYNYNKENTQWLAATERRRLQEQVIHGLAFMWALAAVVMWDRGAVLFEASPKPAPDKPEPLTLPPPIPRDDWWKKYY